LTITTALYPANPVLEQILRFLCGCTIADSDSFNVKFFDEVDYYLPGFLTALPPIGSGKSRY